MTRRRGVPRRRVAPTPIFDEDEMFATVIMDFHWQPDKALRLVPAHGGDKHLDAEAVERAHGGNFGPLAKLVGRDWPRAAKFILENTKIRREKEGRKGRPRLADRDRSPVVRAAVEALQLQKLVLKHYPAVGDREARRLAIKFAVRDFAITQDCRIDEAAVRECIRRGDLKPPA